MKKIVLFFFLFLIKNTFFAQSANNCSNAIVVCGNSAISSNATGYGIQEVSGCSSQEHNSLWLKLNIVQSGTLGFDLIPDDTDINVDYDFWIYGPNVTCASKGSPIRCSTTNPAAANLSNNHTGMNGTAPQFFEGPGIAGISYVKWLNVLAGQSYYVVIDRPAGDGGFQLNWTGTAMSGAGAFTTPPSANSIPAIKTCSTVLDSGIFDLDGVRSSINSDLTNNSIIFYESYEDAFDGIVTPLDDIISNSSNPQTVYAKVKNNASGCFTIVDFQLIVNQIPDASISVQSNLICQGQSAIVNFSGSPNTTVFYKVNGGPQQSAVLNASGTYQLIDPISSNTSYQLVNVVLYDEATSNVLCSQVKDSTVSVTVQNVTLSSLTSNTSVCVGQNAVFTINGTPNAVVTYKIDDGANLTTTISAAGTTEVTVNNISANVTITLLSIVLGPCNITLNNTNTVTIVPTPLVNTLTSNSPICEGNNAVFSLQGTPNGIVTYSINGGSNQTITLNGSGAASVSVTAPTSNQTIQLKTIQIASCIENLTQNQSVTILTLPSIASLTSNSPICLGENAIFSIEGTPNTTVNYSINSGVTSSVSIGASGLATITVPSPTIAPTIVLSQIIGASCSKNVSNTTSVVVLPIPNVSSVTSNTPICIGSDAVFTINGTPNAIITYTLNNGASQTSQIPTSGTLLLNVAAPTVNPELAISLIDNGTCTKTLTLNSTVVVNQPPAILNITSSTPICRGSNAQFVIQGTPSAEVFYSINGGTVLSVIIGSTGFVTISIPAPTSTVTMNLSMIRLGACDVVISNSSQVIVNQLPQLISVVNNSPICSGSAAEFIVSGTPFSQITYSINSLPNTVASFDSSGSFSIILNGITATTSLQISSISDTNCTAPINQLSQVFVSPATTISMISATGSNNQMRCENAMISPIQYQVQGTATGVTVSGLPLGINHSYNTVTKLLTISGAASVAGVYPFTVETSGGCAPQVTETGTFTITDQPNMNLTYSNSICSGAITDIVLSSDLSNTTFTWTATVTNISATYNMSGTQNDINQLVNLSNTLTTGKIVMTITPFANGCSGNSKTIEITVNPIPQITSITNEFDQVCSGSLIKVTIAGFPSNASYLWTSIATDVTVIGATSGTTTGIIYLQVQLANPLVAGTVQFQITPTLGTCSGTMQTSTLINVLPYPNLPQTLPIQNVCSGTALNFQINDSPHVVGTTLTWEVDQMVNATGATSGSGLAPITITDLLTATNNQAGYVIYKVKSVLATCETDYVYYRVNVNAIPEPILQDGYMCLDADGNIIQSHYLNAGSFTGTYQFFWHKVTTTDDVIGVSSGAVYQVYTPGNYYVIARNVATGCYGTSNTVEVTSITSPSAFDYSVTDAFSENATINVTITGGTGNYFYQLDNGPLQTDPIFQGVSAGFHELSVINDKGCSRLTKNAHVIGYPKYFTPNGDGINDTWNIIGLNQANSRVYIYDRYGKFIKSIIPLDSERGWDGTYEGNLLPSTDYWFSIEYIENSLQKIFKSHFTLKR